MASIIKTESLVKDFGKLRAVDNLNLEVQEGTIFGFLGPNGAGKTTTINILCTLLKPTSGRAYINGYDCVRESARVRSSIGIVFQDTTLDKDLTAYENLLFHSYLYGLNRERAKKRIEELLHFMDLYERKDEPVRRFSGGMKRRLEVARGLMHYPRVLFLDEPTLGLDPQSRAGLWEHIVRLPETHNVTVFMTTHYMDEAEVCNRVAIIDHGRIIAEGSPEELKRLVGGDVVYLRTKDNKKAMEILSERIKAETGERDGEIFVHGIKGDMCIPELIKILGDQVISVRLQRPTLNDVFLKLTGRQIRDTAPEDEFKESIRAYRRRFDRG
ncbi:MAG: ATP-binding cassette domain-containing protein [Thermodesulfovibrionales bacterium]|nr:ATP-binding cassette domain-containing protein [Thermodesulfovibrionales bacterium]